MATEIRRLTENEWDTYRTLRLASLKESPQAFTSEYDDEVTYDEARWRDRMGTSVRLAAYEEGEGVGIVSVGRHEVLEEGMSEVFALWVRPESRGTTVATDLMDAAVAEARALGLRRLCYWVDTDNGRAVAFASGYGYRPTSYRRTEPGPDGTQVEEIALVLPVGPAQ